MKKKCWKRNDKKVATIMRINFFCEKKERIEQKREREGERESEWEEKIESNWNFVEA